jgi:hypothetical protein
MKEAESASEALCVFKRRGDGESIYRVIARGKVSILGGDSSGHCAIKRSHEHVSNCEWLPR